MGKDEVSPIVTYFIIGFVSYPALMDMWYRIQFSRREWHNPYMITFHWYFGFMAAVLFWPIAVPVQTYRYIKEMKYPYGH